MAEPYCLAMVLCDAVHRDPSTGKFTILGTFDSFVAPAFPAHVNLSIYFAVTDSIGQCTLRLQLVDAKVGPISAITEGDVQGRMFRIQTEVDFADPMQVQEHAVGIETPILAPGVYHCELWANDSMLMTRRFVARELKGNKE